MRQDLRTFGPAVVRRSARLGFASPHAALLATPARMGGSGVSKGGWHRKSTGRAARAVRASLRPSCGLLTPNAASRVRAPIASAGYGLRASAASRTAYRTASMTDSPVRARQGFRAHWQTCRCSLGHRICICPAPAIEKGGGARPWAARLPHRAGSSWCTTIRTTWDNNNGWRSALAGGNRRQRESKFEHELTQRMASGNIREEQVADPNPNC